MTFTAHHDMTPSQVELPRSRYPRRPARDAATGRAVLERRIIHIPDIREDAEYGLSSVQRTLGFCAKPRIPNNLQLGAQAKIQAGAAELAEGALQLDEVHVGISSWVFRAMASR
jgi:hypothetical protein